MPPIEPYNEGHRRTVEDALRKLHDALQLIEREERCGTDCQMWREMHADFTRRLEARRKEWLEPDMAR